MQVKKTQPAQKGYFFGQGYKDVATSIKMSWIKNAQPAKRYYIKYKEYGIMSFGGIFNLFCSTSVVTFGTLFFVLISVVMLAFISLLFMEVYIGFGVVWLFDRAYLVRKKIFTACHECKEKFLIPIYLCPECGAKHTNLTPGVYGILHRTCNCGKKLPTAFFNGRKKLKALCPKCLDNGKTTFLNDRESRPLCIPVVGGRSVGKTAYITAFSKLFIDEIAPQNGLNIKFYNDTKKEIYTEIMTDYESGSTRMTARSQDINQATAVSFSFFVEHRMLRPERLLHIYDIAGEVFTDNNENEVQKQYEYCQGIIFIIDPFAIPSVKARYESSLTAEDRAGIGHADINGIINSFINKLHEVTGLSDRRMSNIPIAILIGKTDSAKLADEFSDEKIKAVQAENLGCDRHDAIDILCRKFLRENAMEGFLNVITMKFKKNRFFSVSAIGHSRDAGKYEPIGVVEPMEWIISLADKKFYSLWGKNKFTNKMLQG